MLRRLIRWAGNASAAFLLLLCVATVGAWLFAGHGSARRFFAFGHAVEAQAWGRMGRRAVSLEIISGRTAGGRFFSDWMDSRWQTTHTLPLGVRLGIRPASDPHPTNYFRVVVPCRVLAGATAAPALLWFGVRGVAAGRRRRQRAAAGDHPLCTDCGYDLSATPHRCPECGLVAHAPKA